MTPKQQRFVDEYLKDLNATQAAKRAGYSAKTANEQGAQLLAKVSIREAVDKKMAARSERTKIDADWVLKRLAGEAAADLAEIYTEDGKLKPIHKWPLVWRQGLVSGLDVDEEFNYIVAKTAAGANPDEVAERVKRAMRRDRDQKEGKEDFDVRSSTDLIESFFAVLNIIQAVFVGIA